MEQNPNKKIKFDCVVWDCKKCGCKHTTNSRQVGVCQNNKNTYIKSAREYVDTEKKLEWTPDYILELMKSKQPQQGDIIEYVPFFWSDEEELEHDYHLGWFHEFNENGKAVVNTVRCDDNETIGLIDCHAWRWPKETKWKE